MKSTPLRILSVFTTFALVALVHLGCARAHLRFDCVPDAYDVVDDQTKTKCRERGCTLDPVGANQPACYYPDDYPTYNVESVQPTSDGFTFVLVPTGKPVVWPPQPSTRLGANITFVSENTLRVKIFDLSGNLSTFETNEILESPLPTIGSVESKSKSYKIDFTQKPFGFKITRVSTGTVIFDTTISKLVFAEMYKEISSTMPTKDLYGLAEHKAPMYLNQGKRQTYTFFNRGEQPEERNRPQFNLYGYHPYYVALEKNGNAHGVYFHSSHALDIVVQPDDPSITYRTVGSNLDFFFFLGPSPDDVTSQYTAIVGRPFMPPYWALGFHLCRYNYHSANRTKEAWHRTREAGIPLDAQWNDIDYMEKHKDFTYDSDGYANLPAVIDEFHSTDTKYIINVSPGLSHIEPKGSYKPYDIAYEQKLFVNDPQTDEPIVGKCWQNETVYLDFTNPKTVEYWTEQLQKFHEKIKFDALWLDMNEPYSFRSLGEMGCDLTHPLMNLPYSPGKEPLSNSTLCMYAKHHLGRHFDTHTLYSLLETKATYNALRKILPQRRPWIISRATSAGQGRYSSHWNGDITAEWSTMRSTIANMITFNMMGMPLIGSDICGFMKNTTKDLCLRWHQLGAFYTFSRNHNDFDTIDHDPVAMGPEVVAAARESLKVRYLLLPYLYTLFYKSHLYGTTVAKPLFFEFPNDKDTLKMDEQFMWGDAIMFNPALYQDKDEVDTYFPEGHWYSNFEQEVKGPKRVSIKADKVKPNINFRSGHVIPTQEAAATTVSARKNPFGLLVYVNPMTGTAKGELYWDDGDTLNSPYTHIAFTVQKRSGADRTYDLVTDVVKKDYDQESMILSKVTVLNIHCKPRQVTLNGDNITSFVVENNMLKIDLSEKKPSLLQKNTVSWSCAEEQCSRPNKACDMV